MEPRDAATVMLVRDAPGLEVFMVRRNLESRWVAGAYLFPGGAVDDDDGRGEMRFRVAAIRESFEEAGVLLARSAATGEPCEAGPDLDADRRALIAGDRTLEQILDARGLVPDDGALELFARWITPPGAARRYDTWFFVAEAPEGHTYVHDDDELVASEWVQPAAALDRARRDEIQLIYPTYRSVQALARFDSAAELLATVRGSWRDTPGLVEVAPGNGWVLPFDAEHDAERHADAVAHASRSARAEAV